MWVSTDPASAPRFREHLLPSPTVWVASVLVAASFGLVVLVVWGAWVAVVVAIVAVVLVVAALLASSAVVEVTDQQLRAGRARIPLALLGRVRVVDAERMRALLGPQGDVRAYLCQRGWIAEGVLVEVTDPEDPAPYWLMSSRQPQRLAAAIVSASTEPPDQAHSRQTA